MSLGSLAAAFNAQNVHILLNSAEIITCHNVIVSDVSPRFRINTRAGAADFYSFPLIQVTFEALVTKTIYNALRALRILTSAGALPTASWSVVGNNLDGSPSDDINMPFTATVPELTSQAGETGNYSIRATIIVTDSSYPSSF